MPAPSVMRCALRRSERCTALVLKTDFLFWLAPATAQQVPGVRFIGYPRGGHLVIGNTQEISAAIAAFLGCTRRAPPAAQRGDR